MVSRRFNSNIQKIILKKVFWILLCFILIFVSCEPYYTCDSYIIGVPPIPINIDKNYSFSFSGKDYGGSISEGGFSTKIHSVNDVTLNLFHNVNSDTDKVKNMYFMYTMGLFPLSAGLGFLAKTKLFEMNGGFLFGITASEMYYYANIRTSGNIFFNLSITPKRVKNFIYYHYYVWTDNGRVEQDRLMESDEYDFGIGFIPTLGIDFSNRLLGIYGGFSYINYPSGITIMKSDTISYETRKIGYEKLAFYLGGYFNL